MTSKMAQILEILGDGKWHPLSELQEEVGVSNERMLEILGFLSKYEFMKVDYVNEKAKIARNVRDFLTQRTIL
jgi:hypothetical protein